jgi:hypothetical protein
VQPPANSTAEPPQPALLPQELLARWSRTRILIAIAGWCGMVLAALMGLSGLTLALVFFGVPKSTAGGTALLFVAAVTFAQSLSLVRQARAIQRATATRALHDARQVLAHQIDYWKFACTWGLASLLLFVAIARAGGWGNG